MSPFRIRRGPVVTLARSASVEPVFPTTTVGCPNSVLLFTSYGSCSLGRWSVEVAGQSSRTAAFEPHSLDRVPATGVGVAKLRTTPPPPAPAVNPQSVTSASLVSDFGRPTALSPRPLPALDVGKPNLEFGIAFADPHPTTDQSRLAFPRSLRVPRRAIPHAAPWASLGDLFGSRARSSTSKMGTGFALCMRTSKQTAGPSIPNSPPCGNKAASVHQTETSDAYSILTVFLGVQAR
jgi:hypothetical protein